MRDWQSRQLHALMRSLSGHVRVYGRVQAASAATVEGQVFALARQADADWGHLGPKGSRSLQSPDEVAAALHPVDPDTAVDLLAMLSSQDLAYRVRHRDPDHARRAAAQVAELLGYGTKWWTNTEYSDGSRGWDPVTRCTFDGVVSGVGAEYVISLLQVAED
ncbi:MULTISPECIES: hypothetical protein [Streptomycetaceae]|uniref:Uncharacterized protein n=1 Tax=Streptantibioticus cattleyicolor (strain ATCC 35852 / DSM 46488 / JCM 4925 / NBRC 14057 / NRRL 8057) TaxID=1003195 RepID=G8WU31_STREN|nr:MULTISPECIES: hypothetical protein [Streptomycetaceae]AEW94853.1 hypothetical protein SCATT_24820 [Streptantibioticus cattleyicolor NRRL 8057 = DSM 46488]MYS59471.1 hypothetical protein [Streptomyces sp. SID5468]